MDYHQDRGDFLAAQQIQERPLVVLTEDIHKNGTANRTTGAIQRLIELYKKSRNRLGTIAGRLGLDIEMCLSTVPLLHQVVSQNNGALISAVISELKRHGDLVLDFLGRTAVHYAVERHGVESIRCLLKGRRYLDTQDYIGRTAFQIAKAKGDMEVVQLLDPDKVDVNCRMDGYERTLLQSAAGGGSLEIMKLLHSSELGASYYSDVIEALHLAAGGGNLEFVKLLLSRGVDVNAPGSMYRGTVLHTAVSGGNLEVVKLLLSSGAHVNTPASMYSGTVLHAAASGGNLEIVKLLLSSGADLHAPMGIHGATALGGAIDGGHLEIVKLLLSSGADASSPTSIYRGTALQAAIRAGHPEITELLFFGV